MGLFGKMANLGSGLKDSLATAAEKIGTAASDAELGTTLSKVKGSVLESGANYLAAGKEKASGIASSAKERIRNLDTESLKDPATYANAIGKYKELSVEKVSHYFKSTFEIDKTTAAIIDDVRNQLPSRPQDVDDIFEQCKREAYRRAISAFCLSPLMTGLDSKLEDRYANLSTDYTEFSSKNNLHDNENFSEMKNQRKNARDNGMAPVKDGYNANAPLNPYDADIEHIIPKQQYYNDLLLRVATNDDEIIDALNNYDNLIFANESVNRSKGAKDLVDYLEQMKAENRLRVDENDPDLLHLTINGEEYAISESDAMARYENSKERLHKQHIDAMKEIGLTVASAGARMAAQQIIGLIIMETVDIFVDEIKDLVKGGNIFDEKGIIANINERQKRLTEKLTQRFNERQILTRAKEAGIEGGISGALSAIPQILISLIVKMPSFMLAIIRECTLSVVRSVRVLLSKDENKFDSIKIIMMGTASAVLSVYVSNVISKAIRAVPMLNAFNSQVTSVLSGVVVTAAPLGAIYLFDKNKTKLQFKQKSAELEPEPQY